jgi:hypothetical protein
MQPVANTRDEARRFVAAEKQRWDKVIQQGHVSAD